MEDLWKQVFADLICSRRFEMGWYGGESFERSSLNAKISA